MFYEQISKEEISDDIKQCYEEVRHYIGQLVIHNHKVYRFLGLLRDDKADGEWCYRLLVFPSEWEWRRAHWKMEGQTQCIDPSILCGKIISLKGHIKDKYYDEMEEQWKMNEERCPYSKDYTKY